MAAMEDIWQLKIPIRLVLAQDEISSPGDVKPVYLLAPRLAYLPALAQQCLSFFQHVLLNLPGQAAGAQKQPPTPWFEFEGLALTWTQPLGVLHDLLTPQPNTPHHHQQHHQQQQQQPGSSSAEGVEFATSAIPWCLTVHYRNQPASLASSWQNKGTAQDHFFTSLKEAGYCCRGSEGCNAVMRLSAQDELWGAVNRGDAAAVRHHLNPLRLTPTQRQGSVIPTVPVRLYIRQHKAGSTAGLSGVWSEVYSSSRAIEVQQPDGSSTVLAHLVHTVMPQRFPAPQQQQQQAVASSSIEQPQGNAAQQQSIQPQGDGQEQQQAAATDPLGVLSSSSSKPSASSSDTGAVQEGTAAAAAGGVLPAQWPQSCAVYVCGIQPAWCTPLGWLHANLKAADGFLYVVVHLLV